MGDGMLLICTSYGVEVGDGPGGMRRVSYVDYAGGMVMDGLAGVCLELFVIFNDASNHMAGIVAPSKIICTMASPFFISNFF